jgi:hypothetical protein
MTPGKTITPHRAHLMFYLRWCQLNQTLYEETSDGPNALLPSQARHWAGSRNSPTHSALVKTSVLPIPETGR